MIPEEYRIRRRRRETADIFTLELEGPGMDFLPGQFNMLSLVGFGEVPISISGDPSSPTPLIHTIRLAGSVTGAIERLKKGDAVGIRGPFGRPWPVEEAKGRDLLVIAGGLGLAPLRPVIYHLVRNRESFGRVEILYGARIPEDILFKKELKGWSSRLDIDLDVTIDRAREGWRGNVGFVTTLIPSSRVDRSSAFAFVCGPELMMRFSVQEVIALGFDPERIFISMERSMRCGMGFCGHCQIGPHFVCKDGPVFSFPEVSDLLGREI